MSKQVKKGAIAFKNAGDKLVKQVEAVMEEAKRHQYSVSRVYAAYNAVFQLNEKPQTCGSCLKNRAEKLTTWYRHGNKGVINLVPTTGDTQAPPAITVNEAGDLSGEPTFAITYIVEEGEERFAVEDDGVTLAVVNFTPAEEGAQYGEATDREGNPAPAFTYRQNAVAYMVNADNGKYTVVTGEPIAEVKTPAAEGVTVLTLAEEGAKLVYFTSDDQAIAKVGSKGLVKYADGSNVKSGKHALLDGTTLAVAVGARATIKE